jgi:hypothetical protein
MLPVFSGDAPALLPEPPHPDSKSAAHMSAAVTAANIAFLKVFAFILLK